MLEIRKRKAGEAGGSQNSEIRNQKSLRSPLSVFPVRIRRPSSANCLLIRKDQFCFKHIREPRGQAKGSRLVAKTRMTDDGKQKTEKE